CVPGQWGGIEFDGDPDILDNLHKQIFPAHGSRLTRADMAEHFQETKIIMDPLEFGPEIKAVYEKMEAELAALAKTESKDKKGTEESILTIRLRARQRVELLKVPEIVERIEDLVAEGVSVAVFVNFTATLDAIRARISMPSGVVSGKHADR